mmetsp:Transcript_71446/g.198329  ORF Transcript_71446/g.198329 Transcript_71446/m.198329 type:complete len:221 (+) Transcript_71446:1538-2200(+)
MLRRRGDRAGAPGGAGRRRRQHTFVFPYRASPVRRGSCQRPRHACEGRYGAMHCRRRVRYREPPRSLGVAWQRLRQPPGVVRRVLLGIHEYFGCSRWRFDVPRQSRVRVPRSCCDHSWRIARQPPSRHRTLSGACLAGRRRGGRAAHRLVGQHHFRACVCHGRFGQDFDRPAPELRGRGGGGGNRRFYCEAHGGSRLRVGGACHCASGRGAGGGRGAATT